MATSDVTDAQHDTSVGGRPVVTVDVFSDVVCPWCYIGKRRFEAALAELGNELPADVQVTYRPYQLDPTAAPGVSSPVFDAYAKKFGGPERAAQIIDHVTTTAAGDGLDFRLDRALRANTLLAHRLIWLAGLPDPSAVGVSHRPPTQEPVKERLLQAYFVDGLPIGDPETLADCAAEVGYDRDQIVEFLASEHGVTDVRAELAEAGELGITAVPTYVFNGQWAVPGAQDPSTFVQVLRKMADKAATAADTDD